MLMAEIFGILFVSISNTILKTLVSSRKEQLKIMLEFTQFGESKFVPI